MSGLDVELSGGFGFRDLYDLDGLDRLDAAFLTRLDDDAPDLAIALRGARAGEALPAKVESELLIALAPRLEDFLAEVFGIRGEVAELVSDHKRWAPLHVAKRLFVQRRAAKAIKPEVAVSLDGSAVLSRMEELLGGPFDELTFARNVLAWMDEETTRAPELEAALNYAAWALFAPAGRERHGDGLLFQQPAKIDPERMIEAERVEENGVPVIVPPAHLLRERRGFDLTDAGPDRATALDLAGYCISCHNQGRDSCSKGLPDRKAGGFAKSVHGVPLEGCPLEERISEMNTLKAEGVPLGALAVAMVDNPMIPATGHRICNDCVRACVYQKQTPVDIPSIESRTLRDVLELPWGFEIYSLLTRWNPLNLKAPLPKRPSGRKVLVVGLGPAGYALSHHLLNDGHSVVAIDGLKIEPLPEHLSGVTPFGEKVPFRPTRDVNEVYEALGSRVVGGFGGVAEYGITVRWNKNYLKLIRLALERRREMTMIGGVRFGGAIDIDRAFALGFDHIALCMGAGRPTSVNMKNGLARGVRQASDFLMALQLTGAAKKNSVAGLQIRLPAVVIGGGLTAVDTATEALAYYPVQVERFLKRHETLVAELGEETVRTGWSVEDREVGDEFIAHAHAIRAEREAAEREGRDPRIIDLLNSWGGATLVYRRRLIESPAYTLNHEEIAHALAEGIRVLEQASPGEVVLDEAGAARAIKLTTAAGEVELPARSVLIAAGTQPNTVLAREEPGRFHIDGKNFQAIDEEGNPVSAERSPKTANPHVLTLRTDDGRFVSFHGDLHPSFSGNVVKALAGAKRSHGVITNVMKRLAPNAVSGDELSRLMNDDLRATVHSVERLTSNIVEVTVRAPAAARAFRPGQFYRLQNFETTALSTADTTLAMEGCALTGASVDPEKGLLSMIVLEMGGSSSLIANLKVGEPVVVMGPTGEPTEIPDGGTIALVGGGLGNAVLFSIGQAARAAGCRVIYFAGYRSSADRYKIEQIERAADRIVWSVDKGEPLPITRAGDMSFVGNIVEAMRAYSEGRLGPVDIPLSDVSRMIVIGSDRMMSAVAHARHGVLAPHLSKTHAAIGSINSPMQCMMKEICAQCLQRHVDPITGREFVVFSCYNQDQDLDSVDFINLNQRLRQNATTEKLTAAWIKRALERIADPA